MPISFVGSATGLVTSADLTVNFSSLLDASGSTPTLQQNDIVLVTLSRRATTNAAPAITTAGYASIYTNVYANSTDDTNLSSYYKFMGAPPDTSVVITGPGTTQIETYSVHVLRGVDTTTPFDGVTPTTATATGAASPNAPAITPATAGAWIMACGGAAGPNTAGQTTVLTNPANLDSTTNFFRSTAGTRTATGAGLYSGWTSGPFDPAAFGGGSQNASGSVAAATFALRPASGGGVTATASPSIGSFAGSATGQVRIKAAASVSPSSFGSSGQIKVRIKAGASVGFGAFVSGAAAKALIEGSGAGIVNAFVSASTAKVRVKAASAQTVGSFTSAATIGAGAVHASLSVSLSPFLSSAAARALVEGVGAGTLNQFSSSSSAKAKVSASGAPAIGEFGGEVALTLRITAAATINWGPLTLTAQLVGPIAIPVPAARTSRAEPRIETTRAQTVPLTTYATPRRGTG